MQSLSQFNFCSIRQLLSLQIVLKICCQPYPGYLCIFLVEYMSMALYKESYLLHFHESKLLNTVILTLICHRILYCHPSTQDLSIFPMKSNAIVKCLMDVVRSLPLSSYQVRTLLGAFLVGEGVGVSWRYGWYSNSQHHLYICNHIFLISGHSFIVSMWKLLICLINIQLTIHMYSMSIVCNKRNIFAVACICICLNLGICHFVFKK